MAVGMKRAGVAGLWLVACSGGGSEGKSTSLGSQDGEVVDADVVEHDADPDEPDATEQTDGGVEDAGATDAGVADGGPLFQLDVVFDGTPAVGLGVALHDPSGAVRELLSTDARGHAESAEAVAYATVFLPSRTGLAEPPMPFTYVGLEPGDHLRMRVRDGSFYPDRAPLGELAASVLPVNSERPWNTLQLELGMSSCHDGQGNTVRYESAEGQAPASPITIGNFDECSTTPLNLLATAQLVGDGQEVVAYSFLRDVPLPGAGAPTAVELPAWQLPSTIALLPANLPDTYTGTTGNVTMVVGEERFETEFQRVPSPSGLLGRLMPFAAGFGDALELTGFAERYGSGTASFLQVIRRQPEAAFSTVDFALPETLAFTVEPGADVLTLGRTLSGELAGADAQIFTLQYGYDIGEGVVVAPWYVLLPPGVESAMVPLAAAADSAGITLSGVRLERVVTLSDDGLDGYEAFKDRTAFIDLARGLPSRRETPLPAQSLTGLDLPSAIDLAPRGAAGTVRLTGAAPYD